MSYKTQVSLSLNTVVLQVIHNEQIVGEWTILDGPHLQPAWSGAKYGSMYVYARHPETGRTQRLYLSDSEAEQVAAALNG